MGVPRLRISDFREQLVEKASRIFVDWRYVYENPSGTILHLDLASVDHLVMAAQLVAIEAKQQ